LVAALLALVAAGAALMIRDSDAAASLPTSFGKLEVTEASEVMSVVGGN
jgi:hypothetical protein